MKNGHRRGSLGFNAVKSEFLIHPNMECLYPAWVRYIHHQAPSQNLFVKSCHVKYGVLNNK